jgi:hypothetical protein
MARKDPRIDAFIAKAQPFARPILARLRRAVHKGCPQVEETIKWGFPHFMHHGMLCGMASFKQHCAFGFWRGKDLAARDPRFEELRGAMGGYGKIASLADAPSEARLAALVRIAARFNAAGPPAKRRSIARKPPPRVPAALKAALQRDARARAAFAGFPPSARREFCEWIATAKRPETRAKRLSATIALLRKGRRMNWEYGAR